MGILIFKDVPQIKYYSALHQRSKGISAAFDQCQRSINCEDLPWDAMQFQNQSSLPLRAADINKGFRQSITAIFFLRRLGVLQSLRFIRCRISKRDSVLKDFYSFIYLIN